MKTTFFAFLLCLFSAQTFATVVNFDDLTNGAIADGYAGFNWSNGAASIGVVSEATHPGSGYANGTVSHSNTAYNFGGASGASIEWAGAGSFNFIGAFFTSAWFDQEIAFEGYKAGNLVYVSDSYVINTQSPEWINLDWSNIDSLYIYNTSWQWAMDDFTYASNQTNVSEPTPCVLLMLGVLALIAKRKNFKSKM